MNTWIFPSGCGWHRRMLGSVAAGLGMALWAAGAEPSAKAAYSATFAQAVEQVKGGQVREGEALMREAIRQAEAAGDFASVYWNAWKLAQHRAEGWDGAQQLVWFEVTEAALDRRDRTHFKWQIADLPNYVQMLCEKESVLAAQGRMGEASRAHRKAADLLRQNWGPMESDADLRRAGPLRVGILLNLLLDQADHQEKSGRLDASEATFRRCLALAEGHLGNRPDRSAYLSRIANNYAVMLGLVGRDEDEEKYQTEALKYVGGDSGKLITEANRLRKESRTRGPSSELVQQLLGKAERLMAAGRHEAALEVRRQAASVLYDLGKNGEAEELFGQMIGEAQRREYRVVAAHAFYWRAKARGRAGHPGAEADFLSALDAYRAQGAKPYEGRLYQAYAGFLLGNGRIDEALRVVNEAVRMNRGMDLVHLRPELLALKADVLFRAGQPQAADDAWTEILDLLRDIPDYGPNRRLQVLAARLRHLARCGREAELAAAMEQARAFVEQSGLTDYQAKAFLDFKPEEFRAEAGLAEPVRWPASLQPVYTATHAPPDRPAQSWFWLMNPAAAECRGTLRVRGTGSFAWTAAEPSRVEIEIQAGDGEAVSEQALVVPAEDVVAIRLVHARPPADACRFALEWAGDDDSKAEWNLAGDADETRAASTIHQHFAQQNAFFSVALFHEIGGDGAPGGLDFRVRARAPCRVETYDAESLALLAVDADGDGRFDGVGDLLARDEDRDGYPDADRSPLPVVIHVFPVPGERYDVPLDLALEVRNGEEWQAIGLDRLIDMPAVAAPEANP